MIDIEIDGKTLQVEPGAMIIEVTDKLGISVPRFCYHKKLSIAANCRMCLVEVEKSPKPLPACATPVTPGMKIRTQSAKARDAQKAVMEFLLINHPLDCPICDQGGECELQDLSLGYGKDVSRFTEGKRSVDDDNLGSLIATDMTRCIQCTRCVRFEEEVAGFRELGATGRGENMKITTYVENSVKHEMSGNIIDLCPVGALTSKPFRFKARAWELKQTPTIAAHDCMGSHLFSHTRGQKIMRVVPRENESINETWISDRDRYSYAGLYSLDRLEKPLVKIDGVWEEVSWNVALKTAVAQLQAVSTQYGTKQMGALISASATTEELFLLQKMMRAMDIHTIDHRLHQMDFADQKNAPLYPGLGIKIEELELQETILLIGANVQREQPIAGHRIRKATLRGAKVMSINAVDYPFNFEQTHREIITPEKFVATLAGVAKVLLKGHKKEMPAAADELLASVVPTKHEEIIAENLKNEGKQLILLGALAQNHPEAATIRSLAQLIAKLTGAQYGLLTEGANAAGAWLAGALPHRGAAGVTLPEPGFSASTAIAASLRAYVLFGLDPELDCANPIALHTSLEKAESVIAFSPFKTDYLLQCADIIFPITTFAETAGTFVNTEGGWQSFNAIVNPIGEARPGWKALCALAYEASLSGFDYVNVEEVRDELATLIDATTASMQGQWWCPKEIKSQHSELYRVTEWPIYSVDNVVRRSLPLQQSATQELTALYVSTNVAEKLKLEAGTFVTITQGSGKAELPVVINSRIADNCVWIPAGRVETIGLGPAFGPIELVTHK